MTVHRIRLDANRHAAFLAEQRKDPITKESLRAGVEIVICANDKLAFMYDTWPGECPFCHGSNTLTDIPVSNFPTYLGRRNETPQPTRSVPLWFKGVVVSLLILVGIVLSIMLLPASVQQEPIQPQPTSTPVPPTAVPTTTPQPTIPQPTIAQPPTPVPITKRVNAADGLNLRAGPSMSQQIITVLIEGTEVTLLGETRGVWVKVRVGQQEGWVSGRYLE